MPPTSHSLADDALDLPEEDLAAMAAREVEGSDAFKDDNIQHLWAAEALRRRAEMLSGAVKPIPLEEAIAEVRRSIGL